MQHGDDTTNLSYTAASQPGKPGYHHFGDISFRVQKHSPPGPPPAPEATAGTLAGHSIHCAPSTAACVIGSPGHQKTAADCATSCGTEPACACWSYADSAGTCFLLSNDTALPIPDPAATCGWKATWQRAAAAGNTSGRLVFSSAAGGATPLTVLPTPAGEILAVDLGPALRLSRGGDCPLRVSRHYSADRTRGDLLLRYELRNEGEEPLELGSFGVSMVFDQIFSGRTLAQVATECTFAEPSIALRAGYVSVVSTTGKGPVLLLLPELSSVSSSSTAAGFEGWRMLTEDPTPRSVTFEGFYELMAHTKAWAEDEWAHVSPWNPPTARVLPPRGGSASFQYRLTLAPSLALLGETLLALGRPVVRAVPGYVLSMPSMSGTASLTVRRRCGSCMDERCTVASWDMSPSQGALRLCTTSSSAPVPGIAGCPPLDGGDGDEISDSDVVSSNRGASSNCNESLVEVRLLAAAGDGATTEYQGRVRLELTYSDAMTQVIQLYVQPDADLLVQRYTNTLRTRQWHDDPADAFHRTAAILNWDRDGGRHGRGGGQILQESRAWIAGLSDECGAGPAVAMASKNLFSPRADEVALLERYVDEVLWGRGEAQRLAHQTVQSSDFGVRASMFYAGLHGFNYTVSPCWDEARSLTTWRSYNYPHVTIVYWSLYRVARHYGLAMRHSWSWYLGQAVNTTLLGVARHGRYNDMGLMAGSVWRSLLHDLRREGSATAAWLDAASHIEAFMRSRAEVWARQPFPFGSEMPWDSTGQEEVFGWSREFGLWNQSNSTLDAVLAYAPRLPSWAYHGNARRYFDFAVYGSPRANTGTERELHHYGAPLNALVTLEAWRVAPAAPEALYLLEVGVGGMASFLTNINASDGFASMAWHGSPAALARDPYDCDFGVGFYGHAAGSSAFVVGELNSSSSSNTVSCYLCNLQVVTNTSKTQQQEQEGHQLLVVVPTDSFHRRVYFGILGLDLDLEAGHFSSLTIDVLSRTITASLVTAARSPALLPPRGRLLLETPGQGQAPGQIPQMEGLRVESIHAPGHSLPRVRGGYEVAITPGTRAAFVVRWTR